MVGAANVVPKEIVSVVRAIRNGELDRARTEWLRLFPAIDAIMALPFTQAVKAGLRLQGCRSGARAPRCPTSNPRRKRTSRPRWTRSTGTDPDALR
jgi:4-hydroxy-tetrahydrodipicolinate synthase